MSNRAPLAVACCCHFSPRQPAVYSSLEEEKDRLHLHPSVFLPALVADIPVSWPRLSELIHRTQSSSISRGNADLRLSLRGTDCFFTIALLTAILMNGCVGNVAQIGFLGFNLPAVSPNLNELHLSVASRRILPRRSIQTCQARVARVDTQDGLLLVQEMRASHAHAVL